MLPEKSVGIRTEGAEGQRFLGQRNPLVLGGGFAGVVTEFLSLLQRLELPRACSRPITFSRLSKPPDLINWFAGASQPASFARLFEAICCPFAVPAPGAG